MWIADEPTTMLDARYAKLVGEQLFASSDRQLILITHDLQLAPNARTSSGFTTPRSPTGAQMPSVPTWSTSANMLSLYYPTWSFIHRAPTGVKLALLAIGSAALFFLPDSYWSTLVVAVPLLGYLLARLPLRIMATDVARMAFLLVFLLITQLIFNEPEVAATVIARLTTIILGAQLFTRTTKIKHLVASIEKLMTPLKPGRQPP